MIHLSRSESSKYIEWNNWVTQTGTLSFKDEDVRLLDDDSIDHTHMGVNECLGYVDRDCLSKKIKCKTFS